VAVIVVTPRNVLRVIPEPAARTLQTSFVSAGMVVAFVRSIPFPSATGKYGPQTKGFRGAKNGEFGMGLV
jgi:hypothetical protein